MAMMHGHDVTSPPGLAASYGAAPARPPAPWVNPTSQVQCGEAWNVMTAALLQPRKATLIQAYSTITVSFHTQQLLEVWKAVNTQKPKKTR